MNNNETLPLNNGDKEFCAEEDPEIVFEQIWINQSDIVKFGSEISSKSSEQKEIKDFRWTDNTIRLLLDIRLKKEQDFNKPSCKKLKLWRQVASEVNKVASPSVTGEMCDLKYRNLLKTYRANKKKHISTGEDAVKWEYFEIFDQVLGTKVSSCQSTDETLPLNNGDRGFSVEEDTNTYNSLKKDPETVEQILINQMDIDKFESEIGSKSSEQNDIKDFRWTDNTIRLLLDIRLKKEEDFNKPNCKKLKLWRQVASVVNKIASPSVTGGMCDLKYRNLLKTYRANKKKHISTGEDAVKWEYFEIFHQVLGTKASSSQSTDGEADAESASFSKVDSPTYGKRQAEMSLKCYLWNKCRRDEEIRKEKKQRWEDEKHLKEKEIEVLLTLAKAITNK